MSQHDTLTQALQEIADWNSHTTEFAVDYGSNGVRDFYRCIARAALSDTQPAQAAQGEPTCTEERPCINCFAGTRPCLGPHKAAQGAGEVVAGIISEWRDVILNARHNMDGVLDNDQINEVLNVWDDMAIEVERAIGEAGPSNAQAQLRAVEKLIDGSQPIDIPGALAVIRHAR